MAKNSNSRLNIHEALNKRSYDHAIICSFTFEAPFFEEYCLEKLTTLSNNGNITVFIDKGIYEQAILGPESFRPQKANLRYLLYPILVPGVFHPKLVLLAGKDKGKLIIGSANFTRSGITANAEIAGFYEYETGKNEASKALFQQAFKYIQSLAAAYPSENLDSNINALMRETDWLLPEMEVEIEDRILLHNLEETLWEQLIEGIETPVESVSVLSRFFDDAPNLLDKIESDLKPKKILIYTQNEITNLKPVWLQHPFVKSGKAQIFICNYADEGYPQPLHAKAIAIQNNDKCCLAFGSANFSTPALLRTARSGNAEILIKLSSLLPKELQPKDFFDPDNTAVLLKDDSILRNSKNDEDEVINERISYQIRLLEATFKDSDTDPHISINARVPSDIGNLQAKLTFANQIARTLNIFDNQAGLYYVSIPSEIKRLLNENSTVINIETSDDEIKSNSLLITNVKDIKTDKPVRRERNVKEAQQSAGQFFAVLRELIAAGDDEALLTFLNYCDIPFNGFAKPRFQGIARPVWNGAEEGMKKLGEKNLKIYADLHPSAVAFFDKHFRKLQKHIESPHINGIDNFLHIFLAMGGILRSQVERAVIGIEAKGVGLTTEEWSRCRDHVDIYYGKFKELTDCLWKKYLSKLIKENDQTKISELFLPDFQALDDLYDDMLSYRARVESLRVTKLTRTNHSGQIITPGYFHCVFEAKKWSKYSTDINVDFSQVRRNVQLSV